MSLNHYSPKKAANSDNNLPYIVSSLSSREVKEVNKVVSASLAEKGKKMQGKYCDCTVEERARISKYYVENGPTRTAHYFSKLLEHSVPKTTVHRLGQEYLVAMKLAVITQSSSDPGPSSGPKVSALPKATGGRPLLLGKHLDGFVQEYILTLRKAGGIVGTSLVLGAAEGIVTAKNPGLLAKHGGRIEIT
jgi:hypothetical protein